MAREGFDGECRAPMPDEDLMWGIRSDHCLGEGRECCGCCWTCDVRKNGSGGSCTVSGSTVVW